LGEAFFNLLFDPASSAGPVLDVESPCAPGVGRGVSAACLHGDGAVVAFGDYTSPSSSSTSMISTSELFMVVSADTADLVRFPLLNKSDSVNLNKSDVTLCNIIQKS
jgi:hypothetical protein